MFEIFKEGVDVFIKGSKIFIEGFYKIYEGYKDFNKGFYDIDRGVKKTSKAKFGASLHTRSSTFAIRAKPTRRPKIAKELALLQPHMATLCHLETVDYKTIKK